MGPQALGSTYNGLMKPDTDIIIRNTTAKSQLTVDTFSHRINVIRSHSLDVHWEVQCLNQNLPVFPTRLLGPCWKCRGSSLVMLAPRRSSHLRNGISLVLLYNTQLLQPGFCICLIKN